MRILYIHQYFCTPSAAGGVRSYEFAKRWVSAGHNVTVLTATGYDETLQERSCTTIDGIYVRTLGGYYSPHMGFIARIRAFIQFSLEATWFAAKSGNFDIVLATSTPLTVAIPALAAKFITRRPVVFEVRDVWPDAAIEAGCLNNAFIIWLARLLEKAIYINCDHIIPLSTGMLARIEKKGISSRKMTMFPNCCDIVRFNPEKIDRDQLRKNFKVKDKFVILYLGAIGLANNIPLLTNTMKKMQNTSEVEWWFVGDGNQLNYLKSEIEQSNLKNVIIWGKQPKSNVAKFIHAADVGIVSFINKPVYYENSPNKFFDYIAGGLPVIFTRTTWLHSFVKKYKIGFVSESSSAEELVLLIQELLENYSLRVTCSHNARKLAIKVFSREKVAYSYLKLLQQIAGNESNNTGNESNNSLVG